MAEVVQARGVEIELRQRKRPFWVLWASLGRGAGWTNRRSRGHGVGRHPHAAAWVRAMWSCPRYRAARPRPRRARARGPTV